MYKLSRLFLLILMIGLLAACAGRRPNINVPQNPPPAPKLVSQPRVALVLGSGGARGYAHLGVLQVLQNAGVPIDLMVGASAGSIFAAIYSDNHSYQKTSKIMMNADFWSFADVSNIPNLSGIVQGYHLEKFLLQNMRAKNFRGLKNKLVIATTNLKTGEPYIIQSGPIAPAVLASAALPGLVQPVDIYHRTLVDGGVAQPVPVETAKLFHPEVIIAVNIAQQIDPHVPWFSYNIYNRAYDIMWNRLSQENEQGANVIIHPYVGQIGTFALDDKRQLYLAGKRAAQRALPQILALLKRDHIPLHSPSIKMR